jgi:hypothetical protein
MCAVCASLSPTAPIRFGVPPRLTQSAISNGQSPSFAGSARRANSSARTTPAARAN